MPPLQLAPFSAAGAQVEGFQAWPKMSRSPVRAWPVAGSTTCTAPRAVSSEPSPLEWG